MGFRVPAFNLVYNVWSRADVPAGPIDPLTLGPPRATDLECQLRAAGKQSTAQDEQTYWVFSWALLAPPAADLRDSFNSGGPDLVELPAGSGRWYTVVAVDDVAKGFPNEYRIAFIMKNAPWPTPIP